MMQLGTKVSRGALAVALLGSGCHVADTTTPRELSLIAIGSATDATGQRVKGAVVSLQAMWPARSGTRRGCTGQYLIGNWGILTADDGEFGIDLRVNPPTPQICLIVFAMLPGDSVWRDSAAVLANLRIVEEGVVPDTARFDFMFMR